MIIVMKNILSFPSLFLLCLLFSCKSNTTDNEKSVTVQMISESPLTDSNANVIPENTDVKSGRESATDNMEVKTFEVKDSTGKALGWGYDIYVKNIKTIHQPIIPAIPGNKPFKTESEANKIGMLALSKMKRTGNLPTLFIKELDSLGITR